MHLSKSVCAVAVLAGPISSVLGALTYVQITNLISRVTEGVDNANADVNAVNLANGDLDTNTLVQNNENLANGINQFDEALSGSAASTAAQQKSLISSLGEYTDKLATLFEDTGEKAGDFEVPSDQAQIQESANSLGRANDALLGDIERLGKNLVAPVDQMRLKDDKALDDLNNDDEESPLRRRVAFRA